jgi:hypothetical protein
MLGKKREYKEPQVSFDVVLIRLSPLCVAGSTCLSLQTGEGVEPIKTTANIGSSSYM